VGADGSGLRPLSENVIPEDLVEIHDPDAVLYYFVEDRCVYIHLTTEPSWIYDTAREHFWPFDTTTHDSHVLFGPFPLGNQDAYGRIINIHGNIAADSDDVTWALVTGDTAEEAADNGRLAIEAALDGTSYSTYVAATGNWVAGRNHMAYPRTMALWCCVWLSCSGDWAFETASLTAAASGKWS
jgi:hypothetical protein